MRQAMSEATAILKQMSFDSGDDESDVSDVERFKTHAGSLSLVKNALRGIAEQEGRR